MSGDNSTGRDLRTVRRDGRQDENLLVSGYVNQSGLPIAWTGDDEAPYVKVIESDDDLLWYFSPAAALQESQTVFTGGGFIFEGSIVSGTAALDLYIQFFDALTPIDASMFKVAPLPKLGMFSFNFPKGRLIRTGFTIAISSTLSGYTAVGSDVATFEIGYEV